MTASTLPAAAPAPIQAFLDGALPTLLRRLRLWKGLRRDRHQDVIEDMLQELWLDYLTHRRQLLALTTQERHARWFRLLTRSHYREREQGHQHCRSDTVLREVVAEPAPATANACLEPMATHDRTLLNRLQDQACYLKNGRLNIQETARCLRVSPETVRRLWQQVAEAAGFGEPFLRFWCQRLGEVLLSLGIDLLRGRDTGRSQKLRRIQRIRTRLGQRPLPMHLKQLLFRYRRGVHRLVPVQVLADAAQLCPQAHGVQLWLVEAAIHDGNLPLAARSLRTARRTGAGRVPVLLLRARLLEARNLGYQARLLLQRNLYAAKTLLKRVS
jgi:hypothetical protein